MAEQIPSLGPKIGYIFSLAFNRIDLLILFILPLVFSLASESVVGMVTRFVLLFFVAEFLFDMLEQVANGDTYKPSLKKLIPSRYLNLSIRIIFGIGVLSYSILQARLLIGETLSILLAAFFVFGLPASLAILKMEKQLLSMFNPFKIVNIIKIFGVAYFFLFILSIIGFFLFFILFTDTSSETFHFSTKMVFYLLSIYLFTVLFAAMGYLIFQHHVDLNYKIVVKKIGTTKSKVPGKYARVDIYLQEGRYEDVQTYLLKQIEVSPLDPEANEKLIQIYLMQGNRKHMKMMADKYFSLIVSRGKLRQAADFYEKLQVKGANYFPEDLALVKELVEPMLNIRQFKAGLSILNHYNCIPSDGNYWDEIALLKARFLAEYVGKIEESITLLKRIIKRSFNQLLLNEAEQLLEIIQKKN